MQSWTDFFAVEHKQSYFQQITEFIERERNNGKVIYPPHEQVFSAFSATEFDQVKVVILGQDPYHGEGQAHGLSFSVLPGTKPPPSLVNIFKELVNDIPGFQLPQHGCLQSWAEQGVLLLNTVLTVEQGLAHSHAKIGWERFTDNVITALNSYRTGVVFILWGAHAQKKGKMINRNNHFVLSGPHPSPLSAYRGFFGCQHFSETNAILQKIGKKPIKWQI